MPSIRAPSRPSILELRNFLLGRPLQHGIPVPGSCQWRLACRAGLQVRRGILGCHKPRSHIPRSSTRKFSTSTPHSVPSKLPTASASSSPFTSAKPSSLRPPSTHDRGPPSTETTQTDFSVMDVLGNMPAPSTSVDACLSDGFHLNSGVKVGGGSGVVLLGGEAFGWRPWVRKGMGVEGKEGKRMDREGKEKDLGRELRLLNEKGQWHVDDEAWGLLELVWPKPDLLILGLGPSMHPLSPQTRQHINSLGIRVDIQDTRNAAAQFNLLATERGTQSVAAALIPIGWREGRGC